MLIPRKQAVNQGRAMVRVRSLKTGTAATIGVCPACWNLKERRRVLLEKLKSMGYTVQHKTDLSDGAYRSGETHDPRCPFSHLI
ncbi:MAG: hypothetical protein JW822_11170 [Spirochaetales bacterium]|nr:hypothetical protein [Spirochaetales bacterium]